MTSLNPTLNPTLAALRPNPLFRIGALVHGRTDVLHLEFGEPDFATPAHITAAAEHSLATERPTYGPNAGMPFLRATIAERVARVTGVVAAPEQIVVTTGGTGALTACVLALCAPGDEVLVPDPAWPGYDMMVPLPGARKVAYPLLADDGWQPDFDALERTVSPRTRILIVNSPSNPGGAVFSRVALERLVAFAERHNLWLVSDEAYDELTFDGAHVSPAALGGSGRVLVTGTFSKAYAMTGWRLGWVVAPPDVVPLLTFAVSAQINNLPLFIQRAGHAALTGPQDCVGEMRASYRARRDLALELLRTHDLVEYVPSGAFYLLVDVARAAGRQDDPAFDSTAFAEALVRERGIAVAPGAAFGASIPGKVRLSLASSEETLRAGISGLLDFAATYTG